MRRALWILAAIALVLGVAAVVHTADAHAATTPTWRTCQPLSKHNHGAYRILDKAWIGPSGRRYCVHSTGRNITTDSAATPVGSLVVAYPSVRYGAFYGDRDPQSGFPLPANHLGRRVILHVSSTGHATGLWQSDVDAYFVPRHNWMGHGTTELVIVNRASYWPSRLAQTARIGGVNYTWTTWFTCQRMSNGNCDPTVKPWRIILLRQDRWTTHATIRFGWVIQWAIHHALIHRTVWLGDVAYGTEMWAGGRGLTDALTVTRTLP